MMSPRLARSFMCVTAIVSVITWDGSGTVAAQLTNAGELKPPRRLIDFVDALLYRLSQR